MTTVIGHALLAAIVVLLSAAALHDLAARTVPNWVPAGIAALGLGLHLGDQRFLLAAAAGGAVFLGAESLWFRGWLGGGDVKLLAAASFALPPSTICSFLLAVALSGGALATIYLVAPRFVQRPPPGRRRGLTTRILKAEAWRAHRGGPLPYAVAIATGATYSLLPLIAG
jgi:prepilin peptidase CpaA